MSASQGSVTAVKDIGDLLVKASVPGVRTIHARVMAIAIQPAVCVSASHLKETGTLLATLVVLVIRGTAPTIAELRVRSFVGFPAWDVALAGMEPAATAHRCRAKQTSLRTCVALPANRKTKLALQRAATLGTLGIVAISYAPLPTC